MKLNKKLKSFIKRNEPKTSKSQKSIYSPLYGILARRKFGVEGSIDRINSIKAKFYESYPSAQAFFIDPV